VQPLTLRRFGARAVDLAIGVALWQVPGFGGLLLLFWLLLADALPGGASLGKRAFGLRVVNGKGRPCSPRRSVVRNLPLAAVAPLSFFLGWVGDALAAMIGLLVWGFEAALVASEDDGIRIGDIFAETRVVEERARLDAQPAEASGTAEPPAEARADSPAPPAADGGETPPP
jgi:uncharacterized RDD family membrane protein YckC